LNTKLVTLNAGNLKMRYWGWYYKNVNLNEEEPYIKKLNGDSTI
jgi:hypothetical protein